MLVTAAKNEYKIDKRSETRKAKPINHGCRKSQRERDRGSFSGVESVYISGASRSSTTPYMVATRGFSLLGGALSLVVAGAGRSSCRLNARPILSLSLSLLVCVDAYIRGIAGRKTRALGNAQRSTPGSR